jgi:tetrahydromethanopterin S-methyltransferase subunit D
MGFMWLSFGMPGVLEAGAIALVVGLVVCLVAHWIGRRVGWNAGTAIGVALVITLVVAAGVDAWDLFHLSIVHMESPYVIGRTLEEIHDPDFLGTRVVFEFAGAVTGVMLGWYLAVARPRGGG